MQLLRLNQPTLPQYFLYDKLITKLRHILFNKVNIICWKDKRILLFFDTIGITSCHFYFNYLTWQTRRSIRLCFAFPFLWKSSIHLVLYVQQIEIVWRWWDKLSWLRQAKIIKENSRSYNLIISHYVLICLESYGRDKCAVKNKELANIHHWRVCAYFHEKYLKRLTTAKTEAGSSFVV